MLITPPKLPINLFRHLFSSDLLNNSEFSETYVIQKDLRLSTGVEYGLSPKPDPPFSMFAPSLFCLSCPSGMNQTPNDLVQVLLANLVEWLANGVQENIDGSDPPRFRVEWVDG